MKRFLHCLLLAGLLTSLPAPAQIRTAADIDARAFVIGLDAYVYGNGPLTWTADGRSFRAEASGNTVILPAATLSFDTADLLLGIHDFTGDQTPELIVGEKLPDGVKAHVLRWKEGAWKEIGAPALAGGTECRIFRQALTIKDPATGVLYTWTWHGNRFDYKSSDNGVSF